MEGVALMRPHENLEAWSKAVDFVVHIYRITDLPNYRILPEGRKIRLNLADQTSGCLCAGKHSRRGRTAIG